MTIFERHPVVTLFATLVTLVVPVDLLAGHVLIERIPGEYSSYYHHGLKKNFSGTTSWGPLTIRMYTNSLGFRDTAPRAVPLKPDRYRVVFIGDSFTEGVGVPYEQTFVGRIAGAVDSSACEVLDAGVKSGCPKLYVLRLKRLLDSGFRFDELNLFVDISDIRDEVVHEGFTAHEPTSKERLSGFRQNLSENSLLYKFILQPLIARVGRAAGHSAELKDVGPPRVEEGISKWTYDEAVYRDWAARGLALAGEHAGELAALCRSIGARMSVAVYPWPDQIRHGDLDSRQVRFWREFCERGNIPFVDYFPAFIADRRQRETIPEYFIPGDVHWNPAGHLLVARKWLATPAGSSLAGRCRARQVGD